MLSVSWHGLRVVLHFFFSSEYLYALIRRIESFSFQLRPLWERPLVDAGRFVSFSLLRFGARFLTWTCVSIAQKEVSTWAVSIEKSFSSRLSMESVFMIAKSRRRQRRNFRGWWRSIAHPGLSLWISAFHKFAYLQFRAYVRNCIFKHRIVCSRLCSFADLVCMCGPIQ